MASKAVTGFLSSETKKTSYLLFRGLFIELKLLDGGEEEEEAITTYRNSSID